MGHNDNARNIDQEWKNRVLCSDETCIGTIGPDGRCRECGLKYEGDLPDGITEVSDDAVSAPIDDDSDGADDDGDFASEEDGEETIDAGDEWASRTLCRDESCIGVIGPDGKCKECGKPY